MGRAMIDRPTTATSGDSLGIGRHIEADAEPAMRASSGPAR